MSVVNPLVRRNAAGLVVWSGRAICDSKQGIAGEVALKNGMGGKSREFNEKGSKLYAKT